MCVWRETQIHSVADYGASLLPVWRLQEVIRVLARITEILTNFVEVIDLIRLLLQL